jgi:hypothetical protein
MTKKTIDTSKIANDLQGASSFFRKGEADSIEQNTKGVAQEQANAASPVATPPSPDPSLSNQEAASTYSESHVLAVNTEQKTDHDSVLARYHDSTIEVIRKTVKQFGKEPVFVRVTPEEKRRIADIAYAYKRQGIRTTENEISRIGINFLLEDYDQNGERSVLARVIAALLA